MQRSYNDSIFKHYLEFLSHFSTSQYCEDPQHIQKKILIVRVRYAMKNLQCLALK